MTATPVTCHCANAESTLVRESAKATASVPGAP